jgi:hypothetical protein
MKRLLMLVLLALMTAFVAAATIAPTAAAKPPAMAPITVPATGTFTDALGGTGTFAGTMTVERFVSQNGQLAAVGTVTGTLTNSAGTVLGTDTSQVTAAVTQAQGSCQILHLELGPLDLDLLGLVVHLDKVVLDITAQQGPGNLLGNLLCAIAGLLDSNQPTNVLAQLLNQLLALLG